MTPRTRRKAEQTSEMTGVFHILQQGKFLYANDSSAGRCTSFSSILRGEGCGGRRGLSGAATGCKLGDSCMESTVVGRRAGGASRDDLAAAAAAAA